MNDDSYIVFPDFYMYRTESGWRWVSRDATRSSPAAFDFAQQCALAAQREADRIYFAKRTA